LAIPLRNLNEIEKLRVAGKAVAQTLKYLEENVKAGMSLLEVDKMGDEYIIHLEQDHLLKDFMVFQMQYVLH